VAAGSRVGVADHVRRPAGPRDNERAVAYEHLAEAEKIAQRTADRRDDCGTEFGPANVTIHAVSVAVELGDAGRAIDLARGAAISDLSAERRSRHFIDLAAAHAMRRHIGEALSDLQEAERIAPELTRSHYVAREVTRDHLQLSASGPGRNSVTLPSDSACRPKD
jgi:hypothetical protein